MKKNIHITLIFMIIAIMAHAQQPIEGTSYFLPKTAMRFSLLIEKTTYTPGIFAGYAGKYMKINNVKLNPETTYRIVRTSMIPVGIPDTANKLTLQLNKKYTISEISREESGILIGINTQGKAQEIPQGFIPAKQPNPLNPKDFMNEDILTATSSPKMAELCAQEIYDIRESRGLLSRGQADFMPKDGSQLRMMLNGMDLQEQALMQVFTGVTKKDTTEAIVTYIPSTDKKKEIIFRFSKYFGLVDKDDYSGAPYYITVQSAETLLPSNDAANDKNEKKAKDDIGLKVNIPLKISATLYRQLEPIDTYSFYAAQFGSTETLSGELFNKKQTSKIVLDPVTGSILKIESISLK